MSGKNMNKSIFKLFIYSLLYGILKIWQKEALYDR